MHFGCVFLGGEGTCALSSCDHLATFEVLMFCMYLYIEQLSGCALKGWDTTFYFLMGASLLAAIVRFPSLLCGFVAHQKGAGWAYSHAVYVSTGPEGHALLCYGCAGSLRKVSLHLGSACVWVLNCGCVCL